MARAENQVHFDGDEMVQEYKEWMRDNWNHPSVAIWDANNDFGIPCLERRSFPQCAR
jgi:beta-galactosidase/beta-glucuronidase